MKIYYQDGPERISAGEAGDFERGVAREVSEALARALLARRDIRFLQDKSKPRAAQPQ